MQTLGVTPSGSGCSAKPEPGSTVSAVPASILYAADFTADEFLGWARKQRAGAHYNYCDSRTCAVAMFGEDTGREYLVGPGGSQMLREWPELSEAVNPGDIRRYSCAHTFGALVVRLEALLPQPIDLPPSEWTRVDSYMLDIEQVEA